MATKYNSKKRNSLYSRNKVGGEVVALNWNQRVRLSVRPSSALSFPDLFFNTVKIF
jgi:hypothetical protein